MSFFENKDVQLPQGTQNYPVSNESELNDIWRSLLGVQDKTPLAALDNGPEMGVQLSLLQPVATDPWAELLQSHGIEFVDLQQHRPLMIHVSFSEQEVE